MELRSCGHLHFIQSINGGLVTKVLNITRGRPKLSYKDVKDIYDGFSFNHYDAKVERSCLDALEEVTVKTESDSSVCTNDGDDILITNLVEDDFDNFTLNQIKQRCKTRKRKQKQGLDPSKGEIKVEASPLLDDDDKKKQIATDDADFKETLSSWRYKQAKKAKKRNCIEDPISTSTQEITAVVKAEDVLDDEASPPVSGVSTAIVEVEFEVPKTDRPDEFESGECIIHQDSNCIPKLEASLVEDQSCDSNMASPPVSGVSTAIVEVKFEVLKTDRPDEFESGECIIHQDSNCIPKLEASLVEDQSCDSNMLPNMANNEGLDPLILGFRDDNASLCDISKDDEFTARAEVQEKPSSTTEHDLKPGESLVCVSDDSPECKEKQLLSSEHDGEKRYVNGEATDELNSWEEHEVRLKTRKKNNLSCKGKLQYGEQTSENDADEGLNDNMRPGFTDSQDKVIITPKTSKRVSQPKGILKSPRPASRLGFNFVQRCSKSVIAFSKLQMKDVEGMTMKLTEQLKSMTEILDDMLRSEFCLNTSLRRKVLKATIAVGNATKAEKEAKRLCNTIARDCDRFCKIMARDCNRFCKIMKLNEPGPPAPREVVRKERKMIALADKAGGRLCEVKLFEKDLVSLSDSN
ncbi:hypothetical protein PIB30_062313 [Stylosanthes scabra]|uniref:Uncharacterized protein n=1 Tax=Stylosanthes scabra TaxID=79078 RepID=A0ABU6ZJS2_9FABA|nr:hypothetical protein [Stylosanthes scabra]